MENLAKIKKIEELEIKAESHPDDRELQSGAFRLAEVLVTPQSHLAGWTLRRTGFQQRDGVIVIAIYHHGEALREWLAEVALRVGDLLLVRGPEERASAAAALLGHWVVAGLGPLGTMAVVAGFFARTILLTQPMSNAAAAVVVLLLLPLFWPLR